MFAARIEQAREPERGGHIVVRPHAERARVCSFGAPVAATITLDGEFECLDLGPLGCFPIGWAPDLDAQLLDPTNAVIAESTCPLTEDPEACVWGRQETLHATPTLAGTYTIKVQSFDGNPGTFAVDVFHGPVGSVAPPPPAPAVHVGDLDDTSSLLSSGWRAQVRIRVHDRSHASVVGAVVTGTWPNGTKASTPYRHRPRRALRPLGSGVRLRRTVQGAGPGHGG